MTVRAFALRFCFFIQPVTVFPLRLTFSSSEFILLSKIVCPGWSNTIAHTGKTGHDLPNIDAISFLIALRSCAQPGKS